MDDMYPILEAITPSCPNPMVLATVIKVEGSAYKKAGAAMLLRANQSRVGMLTAGCLRKRCYRQGRTSLGARRILSGPL